ncbi:phosphoglucomutase (alpha-D-glucose-1,6-bisphosphate-dependent) [Gallaecimonas sp. GXIMD4217]|uniref:phosphoglucomutase (alpha-D-glucose-1,6-bisphosphate-dependent) n=1 Tax=Gallaecimonas sp. GXIMD4217 TaxID=3131927 RepID=UPI00311B025A
MASDNGAGTPAPQSQLVDIPALISQFFLTRPDPAKAGERVSFGTSGHRGTSLRASFNQDHVLAIAQAVADYRRDAGINGPLYLGFDSHGLSRPAFDCALMVLVANGVQVRYQDGFGMTPTPAVSHAILAHGGNADGLIITPSHNPPQDGGIKYNPPHGGPAGTEVTQVIQARANTYLEGGLEGVKRLGLAEALASPHAEAFDFVEHYVRDLDRVINLAAIREAGVRIAVHPLGGAALDYWRAIAEHWQLELTVVDERVDPRFAFMPRDKDGAIRMDCSSAPVMADLLQYKDQYDLCLGNDPDADRHGIVTPDGLMNPNHYLAVAIDYLSRHRSHWPSELGIGKTLVSSALIDKVVADNGRPLVEVPVGFKWFVDGLHQGKLAFGGEESAGASFLDREGRPWSTDKDGLILGLLAAEIQAKTGKSASQYHQELVARHGVSFYKRIDAPVEAEMKAAFGRLVPTLAEGAMLAGDAVVSAFIQAPGNGAAIGGIKVVSDNGWFAARPSGTEPIYKIYAESFVDEGHLEQILRDAQALLADWLAQV